MQAEPTSVRVETRMARILKFWIPFVAMAAAALLLPWAATKAFGLDERTPLAIAEDTLHEKYGLELVDAAGNQLPDTSLDLSASTFSVQPDARTENVPFWRDGRAVKCTIIMRGSNPEDVTADCR